LFQEIESEIDVNVVVLPAAVIVVIVVCYVNRVKIDSKLPVIEEIEELLL